MAKHRLNCAAISAAGLLLWLTSTVISFGQGGMGQDAPSQAKVSQDEKSAEKAPAQNGVETSPPLKFLWLRDPKTGELVPVPGLTIDEYDKLDRIRRGLPPESSPPPNFVIANLRLAGKTRESTVACELLLEIELRDDQWAKIPLALAGAILKSAPSEKEGLVVPDPASEGFLLWVKGTAGEKKSLKLEFDFPLISSGENTRLAIPLPRARAAQASLTIEPSDAVVRLDGSGVMESNKPGEKGREIVCSGLASGLDLSWKQKAKPAEAAAPWLETAGAIEYRVDGRRQIRADAKLRVRSFGALPQPFLIRLPAGMRLAPDAAPISPLVRSQQVAETAASEPNVSPQRMLELTLDPAAPSDFELRIQTESDGPIAPEAAAQRIDGFEVVGAKRHWGKIDLLTTSDWYVAAEQSSNLRRIDVEPGTATEANFTRARFEYAAQPALIQIAARLPRTLVEPTYDLFIESGQVRLEATLKYRFRGPSAGRVEIDLADWNVEKVTSPDAAFLVDDIEQNGGRLVAPISTQSMPAGAEATLRIEARRTASETLAQIRLPHPNVSVETPAVVRVIADVNLEVTPRTAELKGVSTDTAVGASAAPQRGQYNYRTRPGAEPPYLAFDLQVRRQSLSVDLLTQLTVNSASAIAIRHEMKLNVAYEPLREVVIDLPLPPGAIESARVLMDDQTLERTEIEPSDEKGNWTRCRYALPQPTLGAFNLAVQYVESFDGAASAEELKKAPLPKIHTTSQLQWKSHRLVVRDPSRLIQVDNTVWAPDAFDDAAASTGGERYASATIQDQIAFRFVKSVEKIARVNRADRWWLQTTLNANARSDRLCIRLSEWTAPLRIRLPEGADAASLVAGVDGAEIDLPAAGAVSREITIDPPRLGRAGRHVLELWYRCAAPALAWGSKTYDKPELLNCENIERAYWQLLTPADWYSLRRPLGWTQELQSGFKNWHWTSWASLDQPELERWAGGSTQATPPAELNAYLFSSMDAPASLGLLFAPRRELWLVSLAIVFAVGTLLIYVSALRRPVVLLFLACLATATIVYEPNWAFGVTQFIIVGLAAAAVVAMLRGILAPRSIAPPRLAPSRSSARALDAAPAASDSGASPPRRGSSITSAPAPAGPAP